MNKSMHEKFILYKPINLIWLIKQFGLKIALDDILISFTKWFLGAKRIQITYWNKVK